MRFPDITVSMGGKIEKVNLVKFFTYFFNSNACYAVGHNVVDKSGNGNLDWLFADLNTKYGSVFSWKALLYFFYINRKYIYEINPEFLYWAGG
jgi:hypothetical protein